MIYPPIDRAIWDELLEMKSQMSAVTGDAYWMNENEIGVHCNDVWYVLREGELLPKNRRTGLHLNVNELRFKNERPIRNDFLKELASL